MTASPRVGRHDDGHGGDDDPLILTAMLDDATQDWLDGLRRAHFPPERNHLPAHVTLFHALPADEAPTVREAVADAALRAPVPVAVTGLRRLGRGVAFTLASPELLLLRAGIAQRFEHRLTTQDARKKDLHVTVQNKVDPARARALHAELSAGFRPTVVTATGLALWRYRGGPWELLTRHTFTPARHT